MVVSKLAYHLSYEVEIHAADTYGKYIEKNGTDEKICAILNDELTCFRTSASNGEKFVNTIENKQVKEYVII